MTGRSFESDLVLDRADSCVEQECALFDLSLLANEVLHLLSEEVVLVDVHVLQFAEVVLQVDNVLHYLLERLIVQFDCLMLKGGQLASQQL